MLAGREQTARSLRWPPTVCAIALVAVFSTFAANSVAQSTAPASAEARQLEQTQREEGEAILALADAAMAGKSVPSDFRLQWQNDFVKAQRGTLVPFTLTIDGQLSRRAALVYVRATRRSTLSTGTKPVRSGRNGRGEPERDRSTEEAAYLVDAIFPVELPEGESARISRGFSIMPGEYDVFVVMRERVNPAAP
jgi:hypothetical protein